MSGYYSAPCVADKLFACKKCGKTPTVGQVRYYEKKDDVWLGCVDLECFISQGGSKDPAQKAGGGKFQSQKHPIGNVVQIYELSEALLKSFKEKRKDQGALSTNDELIFIESLMRTLSGNFKP